MADGTPITETYEQILEQPVTGDPHRRTPRADFEMPHTEKDKEVILIVDGSGSNQEKIAEGSTMTKVEWLEEVLPDVVATLENDDAQAKAEQADGSPDKGGCRTFVFSWDAPITFKPGEDESDDIRDLGDLNTANVVEKLRTLHDIVSERGQTFIMPALLAAEQAFKAEFATPGAPHYAPLHKRPAAEYLVLTDGGLSTVEEEAAFESWMEQADENSVVAVAVYGQGHAHNEAVAHWQAKAKKNPYLTVVALTGVSSPREAALDLRLLSGTAPGTPAAA